MGATVRWQGEYGMVWAGMDVAKGSFDVALTTRGQSFANTTLRELPAATFKRTKEGAAECVVWMGHQLGDAFGSARIVMEATGRYSEELAAWFIQLAPLLAPAIVNPARTSAFMKSLGIRNKTDRLEARALAFYGTERRPAEHKPLTGAWAELRELSRYRDALVRERVAQSNRSQEKWASSVVRKMQVRRLRQIERDIKTVEVKMRTCVSSHAELKRDVTLLEGIAGVGFITATTILAELGDLRRFGRARQLTAFAGLSPRLRQSGTSVDQRPHMCKQGNPRVRQALYMAAMVTIRMQTRLQETYLRLKSKGNCSMSALGAVMRKLLTVMRAVLISGRDYEPNYSKNRIPFGG